MLNMYQLWLDDLYPRAKFADALAMVEALGHKKRIQLSRKDWMDEGKPKTSAGTDPEDNGEHDTAAPASTTEAATEQIQGSQTDIPSVAHESRISTDGDPVPKPAGSAQNAVDNGNPEEDDLDALLAESGAPEMPSVERSQAVPVPEEDPFADDMEAMAEMEDMW